MNRTSYHRLFGVSVRKPANITRNLALAEGESIDITMDFPANGTAEAFTVEGFLAEGFTMVDFFGCKLEWLDERGKVLYTDTNFVRCFVNATGTPPSAPHITDPDEEHYDPSGLRWLASGTRRILRVTNTMANKVVPLRIFTDGVMEGTGEVPEVTDASLRDQLATMKVVVDRLVKAVF